MANVAQVLDTRSLTKISHFSGEEKDWPGWDFTFRSYLGLLNPRIKELLGHAVQLEEPPDFDEMGEANQQLANQLFHLLVMLCDKGKPVPILMSIDRENGFAAYRTLKLEYEPSIGGRHAAMLTNLIQPESWKDMELEKFRTAFLAWEVAVTRYETQSGDKLSQPLKIAVVARNAPEEVRKAVRTAQRAIGDSYPMLRGTILDYITGGQEFSIAGGGGLTPWITTSTVDRNSGPKDMEVDALTGRFGDKGGKSQGKGAAIAPLAGGLHGRRAARKETPRAKEKRTKVESRSPPRKLARSKVIVLTRTVANGAIRTRTAGESAVVPIKADQMGMPARVLLHPPAHSEWTS